MTRSNTADCALLELLFVASTSHPSAYPSVHLIVGDDDFLIERIRRNIVSTVCKETTNVPVTTVRAGDITPSTLAELLSPSLFSEDRVVVCTDMHNASNDAARRILDAAEHPIPGIILIIVHNGAGRTKALIPKLRACAQTHNAVKLKRSELPKFVQDEFRTVGVRVSSEVVHALLDGVGSDLRDLSSAISQLIADTGGRVTVEAVRSLYEGTAEVSGFDIADYVCAGHTVRALAATRRALYVGVSPVNIASIVSAHISALARLYSSQQTTIDPALASSVGLPPWKLEKLLRGARTWDSESISRAVMIAAELDAAVKGQSASAEYAVEEAVRELSVLHP